MKKGIDDLPKLDIDYILSVGQEIPTERAIKQKNKHLLKSLFIFISGAIF